MSDTIDGPGATALARFHDRLLAGEIAAAQAIQRSFWRGEVALPPGQSVQNPALLPWASGFDAAPDAEFLFVSGTPRSGTTALGRLLLAHPDIRLFIELYDYPSGYLPEMFAAPNIRRLVDGALIRPLKERNEKTLNRLKRCRMTGDKRPNFMASAALTLANFRNRAVVVVHIVRDIEDIAASYLRRMQDGSFPSTFDHTMAVEHANMNNRNALALVAGLEPGHRLIVVDYESFWSESASGMRLMREIGLDPEKAVPPVVDRVYGIADRLRDRERVLSAEAKHYIRAHYDWVAADRLRALAIA